MSFGCTLRHNDSHLIQKYILTEVHGVRLVLCVVKAATSAVVSLNVDMFHPSKPTGNNMYHQL